MSMRALGVGDVAIEGRGDNVDRRIANAHIIERLVHLIQTVSHGSSRGIWGWR